MLASMVFGYTPWRALSMFFWLMSVPKIWMGIPVNVFSSKNSSKAIAKE